MESRERSISKSLNRLLGVGPGHTSSRKRSWGCRLGTTLDTMCGACMNRLSLCTLHCGNRDKNNTQDKLEFEVMSSSYQHPWHNYTICCRIQPCTHITKSTVIKHDYNCLLRTSLRHHGNRFIFSFVNIRGLEWFQKTMKQAKNNLLSFRLLINGCAMNYRQSSSSATPVTIRDIDNESFYCLAIRTFVGCS